MKTNVKKANRQAKALAELQDHFVLLYQALMVGASRFNSCPSLQTWKVREIDLRLNNRLQMKSGAGVHQVY